MAEAVATQTGVNRREFLFYIWGASIALFTAELTGLLVWFMIPRFREGEFGGNFNVGIDTLPAVNEPPVSVDEGRFWLVNVDQDAGGVMFELGDGDDQNIKGVLAIYKVCTHLGCIYAWVGVNNRFECPCHGSKYRLDGRRIKDPAPRTLDRFKVILLNAEGGIVGESPLLDNGEYGAVELTPDTATIQVDTGNKKEGTSQTLLCTIDSSC